MDLELAQRPVVVEHDRSRAGAREPLLDPLLDGRVDGRRSARAALAMRVATQACEEAVGPAPAVEILDALRHRLETALPLARRQPERGGQALDDAVDVPRVDEERAGKHLCRAGELRQEKRATPAARKPRLGLAQHELLRHEVHPVAKSRDHHHVCSAIEGDEGRLGDVAVDVLDGRHARPPVLAVDAGDQELDLVPLRAVLGAVEARRNDDLDHRRRPRPPRILLEEAFERLELLGNAFRVVETLDPEHEPAPLVLVFEIGEQSLRLGVGNDLAETLHVDPDRIDTDADTPAVDLQRVRIGVDPEHAQARRAEVARVVADLEADVVGAEHAAQELLTSGQQPVHLGRRERDVQEEPDRQPGLPRAQHRRDEHEVEVVHPYARVRLAVLDDRVGEALVDLDVACPRLRRDAQPVGEVVEERPEGVVADLAVEVLLFLGGEEDRVQVILGQLRAHALLHRRRNDSARPADPRRISPEGLECRRQAAGASLYLRRSAVDGQADR